jgi:hypothetical protein
MVTITMPYNERKAHRIDKASQHASRLPRVTYKNTIIEVRKASRSRGYQTDYKPVLTYWVLLYKQGELYCGYSFTESSYKTHRLDVLNKTGVVLPL